MGAMIPDPGHFELSWEQTFILFPPIIQMATITMIIIMKMTAEILMMVFTISQIPCSMFLTYSNLFNHPHNSPNEVGTIIIIPIFQMRKP